MTGLPTWFNFAISPVLGIGGWWVSNRVYLPHKQFEELRAKAREEILFSSNFPMPNPEPPQLVPEQERAEASNALRRLAARTQALEATAPEHMKRFWRWRGFDLGLAAGGLYLISNGLYSRGTEPSRAVGRHDAEVGFKFPLHLTREEVDILAKRHSHPRGA